MIVLTIAVGVVVGLVVGALGAGGGILSVPILVFLLSQDPHAATAESLLIVLVTAVVSLVFRACREKVAYREGVLFGGLSVVGSVLGARATGYVSPATLLLMFSALLVGVSVLMGARAVGQWRNYWTHFEGEIVRGNAQETTQKSTSIRAASKQRAPQWLPLLLLATVCGLMTGFFGVGGGFIVVPLLVLALKMPIKQAASTSLVVMIIASIAGLAGRFDMWSQIDGGVVAMFTLGSAVGGAAGAPLSRRARDYQLTAVFAALLAVVAIFTAMRTLI
ncbi:MAG: sulfite exporter TauE/SafE family protein [Actinomycetaceae bacterium]|nr:sulfite exporter TauE/SafE family protein [Actinomycetaceae bacterium]